MKKRYIFSSIEVEGFEENTPYEVVRTGMQYTDRYGDFSFSQEQLQDMADNFNKGAAGHEIAVDVNHDPERRAYAWIKPNSMYVAESKLASGEYSLFAQLYKFTPEGEHFVKTGAFRYFSIEYARQVKTWFNGKKETFKNVILGLALTNRPAVKGLSPTFTDLTNENMDVFKKLLSSLLQRDLVSKEDKELATVLFSDLSEEDQAAVKGDLDAVTEKPEEEKEETVKDGAEKPKEEDGQEGADTATLDSATLSEVRTLQDKNEEMSKKLSELLAEKEERVISDTFSSLLLSESNQAGFVQTSKDKVTSFMKSLSPEQCEEFSALIKEVQHYDATVYGHSRSVDDASDEAKEKEAMILCEKYTAEGMVKHEALAKAYKELKMTS